LTFLHCSNGVVDARSADAGDQFAVPSRSVPPLGIAIVGGLTVSQVLTLYTTLVVYLWFDRLANAAPWRFGVRLRPAHTSRGSTAAISMADTEVRDPGRY
jgi:hypothetical protein